MDDKQRLNYGKTFLIGFGFFASSLAWSIYNANVPVMLERRYLLHTTMIGFIMTIDNIFGVVFQPLVGRLSDATHTRIGKRMPYILFGIPACALAFLFIPRMSSLAAMMAVIIAFNLIMSIWRSPVVSLMPDLTPSRHRSRANGIINLMGGIGGILAFLVGGWLHNLGGDNLPFLMGSSVMVVALIVLAAFVREPDSRRTAPVPGADTPVQAADAPGSDAPPRTAAAPSLTAAAPLPTASVRSSDTPPRGPDAMPPLMLRLRRDLVGNLARAQRNSLIRLLLAIFFWFCGYNAVETFFTLYATNVLALSQGDAQSMLTFFSLALVAFALPAGILAGKIGRKRMIMIGLSGLVVVFLPMLFIQSTALLRILLLFGGMFWAFVNINSLPMVVELADSSRIGSFTGYYYFFSFSAAIFSPILFGFIRDLTRNYATLFIYSVIAFIAAWICMAGVRHGEAGESRDAERISA